MTTELTYVVITPYSLIKSRTGNIIARLMSLSGCDLVGIRMMRPSDVFVDEYIRRVKSLSISPAWARLSSIISIRICGVKISTDRIIGVCFFFSKVKMPWSASTT